MTKLSALIHCKNNEATLGRTLESLRCADEVVIVDHGSSDKTVRIAKQYGARVIHAVAGVDEGAYAIDCKHDWVLCLLPNEAISEGLEASVFEWKRGAAAEAPGVLLSVREQKESDWTTLDPEMRLADRSKLNWSGRFPAAPSEAPPLSGDLLRYAD